MHQQEPIGYGLLASVNSSCAQPPPPPPPPRANPRELFRGAEALELSNARRWGRKQKANAPPPGQFQSTMQQVFIHYIIDYCRFQRFSLFPPSLSAFCTFFSIRFPHHGTGYQPFKASFHFRTCAVDRFYSRTSQTNTVFFITIFEFLVFIML